MKTSGAQWQSRPSGGKKKKKILKFSIENTNVDIPTWFQIAFHFFFQIKLNKKLPQKKMSFLRIRLWGTATTTRRIFNNKVVRSLMIDVKRQGRRPARTFSRCCIILSTAIWTIARISMRDGKGLKAPNTSSATHSSVGHQLQLVRTHNGQQVTGLLSNIIMLVVDALWPHLLLHFVLGGKFPSPFRWTLSAVVYRPRGKLSVRSGHDTWPARDRFLFFSYICTRAHTHT